MTVNKIQAFLYWMGDQGAVDEHKTRDRIVDSDLLSEAKQVTFFIKLQQVSGDGYPADASCGMSDGTRRHYDVIVPASIMKEHMLKRYEFAMSRLQIEIRHAENKGVKAFFREMVKP